MFWVLGVLYALAQVLVPSLPPLPLSSQGLLTDKYLGKWFFVGVASWDDEDIAAYKGIDNSVAVLHKEVNNSLVMTAALHEGGECKVMSWTYEIDPDLDPVMEEGDHLALAFDGKGLNCPTCFLLFKLDVENGIMRIMLFARSQESREELVKTFKSKMESYWLTYFVIPPQTKEFCELKEFS